MESEITELKKAVEQAESETELENLLRDLQARKNAAENEIKSMGLENVLKAFHAVEYIKLLDAETKKHEAALKAKRAARKNQRG